MKTLSCGWNEEKLQMVKDKLAGFTVEEVAHRAGRGVTRTKKVLREAGVLGRKSTWEPDEIAAIADATSPSEAVKKYTEKFGEAGTKGPGAIQTRWRRGNFGDGAPEEGVSA